MLWFKAWRESRSRFGLSALALVVICASLVFFHRDASSGMADEPLTYPVYIWRITYKGYLRELFMFLVIFLGIGGLTRERDYRTTGFTLALPVSRWRLLATRTVVGLVQVAVLASLPAIALPALSPLMGEAYPSSQAWTFALLWAIVGSAIFAISVLASVLFTGEFAAPVAALFGLLAYSLLADAKILEPYLTEVHDVMSGMHMSWFSEGTGMLTGSLPWSSLLAVVVAGGSLIAISAGVANRQDF